MTKHTIISLSHPQRSVQSAVKPDIFMADPVLGAFESGCLGEELAPDDIERIS